MLIMRTLLAVVAFKCDRIGMSRLIISIAMIGSLVAATALGARNLHNLPAKIAKRCGTPPGWVSVAGKDEVHIQPPPDADYSKVDCVLKELQPKSRLKLGFVGNEADPNRVLTPGWTYIAEGTVPALTVLADEVRKAGWIAGSLAKENDGTGFLPFNTPEGMTEAQATPFANRLWKHELGNIKFGRAPSRNGSGFSED